MPLVGRIQGVTPFGPDGELDLDALRAGVRAALGCGVHGLTVASPRGEGMRLSDEAVRVAEVTVDEAGGRVPVTAGVMRNGDLHRLADLLLNEGPLSSWTRST